MASVATYLNFEGTTLEAFTFYRSVFGGDFRGPIQRFGDVEGMPPLSDEDKEKILHIELPILGGHVLMATDMLSSMGHHLRVGNNITIQLEFDTLEEAQRVFDRLSDNGSDINPLTPQFWGAYWGTCLDQFSIRWMFNAPLVTP